MTRARVPVTHRGPVVDHRRRAAWARGLGLALQEAGVEATLLDRTRRPEDTLRAALVLIAAPDDAIDGVAADLARGRAIERAPRRAAPLRAPGP